MPTHSTWDNFATYTDEYGGAIKLDDGLWYPFGFFWSGEIDITDCTGFDTCEAAFSKYKEIFT